MSQNQAVCAHIHVAYTPISNDNGTLTESWRCTSCGERFNIRAFAPALLLRAAEVRVAELERKLSEAMRLLRPIGELPYHRSCTHSECNLRRAAAGLVRAPDPEDPKARADHRYDN